MGSCQFKNPSSLYENADNLVPNDDFFEMF